METIRELLISLGLDADQASFAEAIGLEHALEKGAELLVEAFKEMVHGLEEVIHGTAEYGHQLEQISERTGMNTDAVQRFGFAAGLAGESLDSTGMSLNHLARAMDGARSGNEEAMRTFSRLGVSVTDAHGKLRPMNDVLLNLGDSFKHFEGPERLALAMAVFGRSGSKLITILPKLRERMQQFDDLQLGMSEEDVKRSAELALNFKILGGILDALKREIAGPLIEAIGPIVDELIDWVKHNRELLRQKLLSFAHALAAGLRFVAKALAAVSKVALFLIDNWKAVGVVLGALLVALEISGAGFLAMGASAVLAAPSTAAAWVAAAAPVLLLAAILALVALAAEDVYTYLKGGDSLIGDIGPKWTKFINDFTRPREEHWLLAYWRELLDLITNFDEAWDRLKKDWSVTLGALGIVRGGGASLAAAAGSNVAAAAGGVTGGDVNAHIEIHPPPGVSPEAIAHESVSALEEWHHRKLREAIAAVGAG